MSFYDISSGDLDPNNDFFRIGIAMDANSSSTISVYPSGGKTILQYDTSSDYVFSIRRMSCFEETVRDLSSSESARVGYPSGLSWVPGTNISPLSNDDSINEDYVFQPNLGGWPSGGSGLLTGGYFFSGAPPPHLNRIEPLTNKSSLDTSKYITSGILIPDDHYDNAWEPSYKIQVVNVAGDGHTQPFIEVENNDIPTTGKINLFSSTQEGAVFSMDLRADFFSGSADIEGQLPGVEPKSGTFSAAATPNALVNQWNSIFEINDGCNAYSVFSDGTNRDEEFMGALTRYMSANWYDALQEYLWGDAISDLSIDLTTRDPETLKNMILYQFYYFGASDDMRALGFAKFPTYILSGSWEESPYPPFDDTSLRWYIGLGAPRLNAPLALMGGTTREAIRELAYLPPIKEYREIWKVEGLPPRTAYAYIVQNNINIAKFVGDVNSDGSTNTPSSSY